MSRDTRPAASRGIRSLIGGRIVSPLVTGDYRAGIRRDPSRLEVHLDAELEQPSRQDFGRREPGRSISSVDRQNRAAVERVVDVELRFETLSLDPEHPAEAKVDL